MADLDVVVSAAGGEERRASLGWRGEEGVAGGLVARVAGEVSPGRCRRRGSRGTAASRGRRRLHRWDLVGTGEERGNFTKSPDPPKQWRTARGAPQ
jgi:hypothetical protein